MPEDTDILECYVFGPSDPPLVISHTWMVATRGDKAASISFVATDSNNYVMTSLDWHTADPHGDREHCMFVDGRRSRCDGTGLSPLPDQVLQGDDDAAWQALREAVGGKSNV